MPTKASRGTDALSCSPAGNSPFANIQVAGSTFRQQKTALDCAQGIGKFSHPLRKGACGEKDNNDKQKD
jgi:hypothetical protein